MALGKETEVVTLHEDEVRRIYQKLESVQSEISGLRTDIAQIKIGLEHGEDDLSRLDKVIKDLDRILYGKGDTTAEGIVTRISNLEKAESKRQAILRWLLGGVGLLGLEAIARFVGLK